MELNYILKHWRVFLYILGGTALLYAMIWIFTFKQDIPLEYKHALDSLDRANAELIAKQKQIDSTINTYKHHMDSLDAAIGSLDAKRTVIHNHYQILGDKVSRYNTAQIDSFFKARYNY